MSEIYTNRESDLSTVRGGPAGLHHTPRIVDIRKKVTSVRRRQINTQPDIEFTQTIQSAR